MEPTPENSPQETPFRARHQKARDAIQVERERQQKPWEEGGEGWTAEHDDSHHAGFRGASTMTLKAAALAYLDAAMWQLASKVAVLPTWMRHAGWPWEPEWWKPRYVADNLLRAGALFQAQADQCERQRAAFLEKSKTWAEPEKEPLYRETVEPLDKIIAGLKNQVEFCAILLADALPEA